MILFWIAAALGVWGVLSVLFVIVLQARISWLEDTGRMPLGQRLALDDRPAATFLALVWPLLVVFGVAMVGVHLWWCVTSHPDGRRAQRARERELLRVSPPVLRIVKGREQS